MYGEKVLDPWWGAQTVNGMPVDEVRSSLQKYIRRGMLEEAVLAGYEMHCSGMDVEELLWRRLEIMAAEEVGDAMPAAPGIVEALYQQRKRCDLASDRWIFAVRAIRLLVIAKKDRTDAELATWTREVVARGERQAEVYDVGVDFHTKRGTELGRDRKHFFSTGGDYIANELEGRPTKYRDYLRSLYAMTTEVNA
jgi:replication-associated recombination protein RarA